MRLMILFAFVGATCASTIVEAAPNAPLCFAIANNYNACVQRQRHWRGGWDGQQYGYDEGYDQGYGDGYDQAYGYGHRHRRRVDCAAWLVAMQANHCM